MPSVHCFYVKTNVLADFQICISVPLRTFSTLFHIATFFESHLKIVIVDLSFKNHTLILQVMELVALFMYFKD